MNLVLSIKYLTAFTLSFTALKSKSLADDSSTNDEINLSSDQIAKLRQFSAENHYVTSGDGYIINVVYIPPVRKTNKRDVIFNHGSTQSSTYFMTNSVGARPEDLSDLDASRLSVEEQESIARKPVAKCLPLLLSCLGHGVWLINKRGTEFSLGRTLDNPMKDAMDSIVSRLTNPFNLGRRKRAADDDDDQSSGVLGLLNALLKPQLNLGSIANTLNPRYWNFSLDEQARYDLTAIIKYVLDKTNSEKVAYVGHSLGNGLMFMLQSEQPDYADKIEPFLAWSPDFYLGNTTSILRPLLVTLQPMLTAGAFPFPPTPIDPLTRTLLASLCQTRIAQQTICLLLEDAMWGFSGLQQETLPAFMASQFYSVSSHEAAQLAQNSEKGKMYHFDFGSKALNRKIYNQDEPPIYNVSRIISRSISLWHGANDALATEADVKLLISDLKVPVLDKFIKDVPFNHYDLLFGRNVSNLVNLPSAQLIESYK